MVFLVKLFWTFIIGLGYLLYLILKSIYKDIKEKEYNKKHPSHRITIEDIFKWFGGEDSKLDENKDNNKTDSSKRITVDDIFKWYGSSNTKLNQEEKKEN